MAGAVGGERAGDPERVQMDVQAIFGDVDAQGDLIDHCC